MTQKTKHKRLTAVVLSIATYLLAGCGGSQAATTAPVTTKSEYQNPLKSSGPDPWVYQQDGVYYYMNTTGVDIQLWKTTDLGKLATAEHKVVWTPETGKAWSHEVWAPEITRWNGKWYIYFCADAGTNETHRVYVLENPSADPMQGTWSLKGKVADASDKWAIDPDVFEANGQHYIVWSGWEGDTDGEQRIYIAHMKDPWTVDTPRVELSRPEYAWEKHDDRKQDFQLKVNEGPEGMVHGNKLFVAYTGSACWSDEYAVGMLEAPLTADPLVKANWSKSPEPLLKKSPDHHAYATGHNGFFTAPNGQSWIIYHANLEANQGCGDKRNPRLQPVTWDGNGMPVFGEAADVYKIMDGPK